LEYIRRVGDGFERGLERVEESVCGALCRAASDPDALEPRVLGIRVPSSTWTYQVDDELPVRFSLSGLASPNIGAALASGAVIALAAVGRFLGGLIARRPGK
jgi:hypothetical protein